MKKEEIKTREELIEKYGKDAILLAVYGTLRKGCGNHHILAGKTMSGEEISPYLGTFVTEAKYKMFHFGGFPGIIEGGTTPITMDVHIITKESIKERLDMLEGYRGKEYEDPSNPYSNLYNKSEVETPWGPALTYLYNGVPRREFLIETGDWLNQDINTKTTKKDETTATIK